MSSKKMDVTVTVSYNNNQVGYAFGGDASSDGTIVVKGSDAVEIRFRADEDSTIRKVRFVDPAAAAIVVGTSCPPEPSDQFVDPEFTDAGKKKVKIKDTKTVDGTFHYALAFQIELADGTTIDDTCDPRIVNQ